MPALLTPCPQPPPVIVGLIIQEVPMGAVGNNNAVFRLTYTPSQIDSLQVWVNGLIQRRGASEDYTFSGVTITFNPIAIPKAGDKVYVYYLK